MDDHFPVFGGVVRTKDEFNICDFFRFEASFLVFVSPFRPVVHRPFVLSSIVLRVLWFHNQRGLLLFFLMDLCQKAEDRIDN
jgi:hypothetical protein